MSWWFEKAGRLQGLTSISEQQNETDHDTQTVYKAVVNTREDVVMLVSLLDSANAQLQSIKVALYLLVGIMASLGVGAVLVG